MTGAPLWLEHKSCRPEHAGLFFPAGHTYDAGRVDYAPALAICGECPVRAECRADAIAHGDIVDGHTTHGQVVGGCAPAKVERPMFQCVREGCVAWFAKRQGANMYCSPACSSEARRISRSRTKRRRAGAA